ncbi:GlcNAc-transferase family protein [Cronobacter sakazakii]|uniref:GlcNAc-transferase family protein n=1 Tax=Cronobacter sakazakii TaxID=28141 RepID=UPI000CFABF7D|nr:GlcNAc-transferase family protein [Cronobacter sakazakii]ELY4857293.1 glycosyltransferase [Cronobacter sakazakii]NCH14405.1 glycosyltransferase [Cronobacter sakazakii]
MNHSLSTLFVSIASYRDPELIPTLKDMLQTAAYPERLHISVCWQDDNDIKQFLNQGFTVVFVEGMDNGALYKLSFAGVVIEVISLHYYASQGACWARHMAETRFNGEDYFLQIDSHCRFIENWDQEMINMVEELRSSSPKPVLSTYPPPYDPDNSEDRKRYISRLIFREFTPQGIVMLSSRTVTSPSPLRCGYLAGGFIFADGSFVKEVPNDPHIFFAGEEIAMAARAWTNGYDIYCPHKILLWHFYGRRQHPKVWADHSNQAKATGSVTLAWWERDQIAKQRVRTLLGLEQPPCEMGKYALGSVRDFHSFEQAIGVNFDKRAVHPAVVGEKKLSFFSADKSDEPQQDIAFIYPLRKVVKFSKKELDYQRSDVNWWHLGIYDENNTLIYRQELTPDALAKKVIVAEDNLDIVVEFTSPAAVAPVWVRLSSFSDSEGWGEVLQKPW